MYWHLVENSGKGTDNVVFTPHITSLLWNQGESGHVRALMSSALASLLSLQQAPATAGWDDNFTFKALNILPFCHLMFCVLEEIFPAPLSLFDMDISTEQRSHRSNFSFDQLDKTEPQESKNECCSMLVYSFKKRTNDLAILNIIFYNMMRTFF